MDALYEGRVRLVILASHEALDLLPISAHDKESCDYDEVSRGDELPCYLYASFCYIFILSDGTVFTPLE